MKDIWSKMGDLITKLKIDFTDIDFNNGIEIMKFINDETSKSLTEIILNKFTFNANQLFLNRINENLPKLKTLKLNYLCGNFDAEPIHFENLNALVITDSQIIPKNLFFDKLNYFLLDSTTKIFTDKWLEFIDENIPKNLNSIQLIFEKLSEDYFLAIPAKLPKIRYAYIECETPFSVRNISQFLDKAVHLEELEMGILSKQVDMNLLEEAADQAKKNDKIWKVMKSKNDNELSKYHTFSM